MGWRAGWWWWAITHVLPPHPSTKRVEFGEGGREGRKEGCVNGCVWWGERGGEGRHARQKQHWVFFSLFVSCEAASTDGETERVREREREREREEEREKRGRVSFLPSFLPSSADGAVDLCTFHGGFMGDREREREGH